MRQIREWMMGLMLGAVAVSPVGCAVAADEEDGGEEELLGDAQQEVVRTAYSTNWLGDRFIHALNPPTGSYVAQLTWKEWREKKDNPNEHELRCFQTEKVMALLPPSETTASVCGSLGLVHRVLGGGVQACVTSSGSQPTPVYYLKWTNRDARELNYRVVDRGIYDYDNSGWLPGTPGNGCSRPW